MTNEITVVSDSRGGAMGRPVDPWSGGGHYGGTPPEVHSSVLKKIHRLLRGRYPLAIALALLCGAAGAAFGWMSRKPLYKSSALIMIKTSIPSINPLSPDPYISDPNSFVEAEMTLMQNPDTVRAAMQDPRWVRLHPEEITDDRVNAFISNVDVEKDPLTNLIELSYEDPDPRSAQAGALSLASAYFVAYRASDPMSRDNLRKVLTDRQQVISDNISNDNLEITQDTSQMGEYADPAYADTQVALLSQLQSQRSDAEFRVSQDRSILGQSASGAQANSPSPAPPAFVPLTADQLALQPGNQPMLNLLNEKTALQYQMQQTLMNYPPTSEAVRRIKDEIDRVNVEIENYTKLLNEELAARKTAPSPSGIEPAAPDTQSDLANSEALVQHYQTLITNLQHQIDGYEATETQLETVKQERDSQLAEYNKITTEIEDLQEQTQLESDQVSLIGSPPLPSAPSDHKREMLAALGFLGGGSLPVGILLLIGLLDQRLRFSDETNREMAGIPLLGILPNLPDLLSDPAQAATAAHCVHQIRTLIQINGHVTDRRAYCVTSGSSGDGKTSLTLALGLSFAASGSRTLMIDADLVGGGLSARLGVRADRGILEAMTGRPLAECVKATDVADLWILPIGHAMGSFAGTISPAALRRLVAEARKQYDVVLIDTGPILGSIEASPVAAAADAVILCVSRGQQRPLVDRALAHLQSIGARLAGVVFNRAQARDFELSVSRSIQTSQPAGHGHNGVNGNGNGANGSRLGPVAKAVATSVLPAENDPN
ncbi:MAG TPA: AAA family ATPase [Tepidisphaeraceae bacterium]|nr:AAA family ATPase [Tepidisphaeraceae bacterium]